MDETFTGGKGGKGRRSALNVSQPRRKAKLQRIQSMDPSVHHLTVAVSTLVIAFRAISRRRKANKRENGLP